MDSGALPLEAWWWEMPVCTSMVDNSDEVLVSALCSGRSYRHTSSSTATAPSSKIEASLPPPTQPGTAGCITGPPPSSSVLWRLGTTFALFYNSFNIDCSSSRVYPATLPRLRQRIRLAAPPRTLLVAAPLRHHELPLLLSLALD